MKYNFFDSNGSFGKGARYNPNYSTAAELLAQMDRLGISCSLVWNIAARDYNTKWGNRRLLEDIRAAGAGNRLVPAFVASPVMLYEEGAVDDLFTDMKANNVRAIRAFPSSVGQSLMQFEPVFDTIRGLNPVIFLDCFDLLNPEQILYISGKYPEITVVLTQGMWIHHLILFDLMRRRSNIIIDTSWLHTPGTIEMVTRDFGSNRMVFGAGYKAHNGASIAALLHADISEEDRRLIAHKNLEKLLGLNESTVLANSSSVIDKRQGILWDKLVNGNSMGLDIIDGHGHLGASSHSIIEQTEVKAQAEVLIRSMDKFSIKTIIISGLQAMETEAYEGNRVLEEQLKPYGKRFLGYLCYNPIYADKLLPKLDDFFSGDFYIGFKLHNDTWGIPVTDTRFRPVWEYSDRHCLPILLHTWQGENDSPAMLKDIIPKYPDAIFILGHSGGGDKGRTEAEELAALYPNVYLEFCGSFTTALSYEETMKKVGYDRIIFGTDALFHGVEWELGRALSLDIPDEHILPMLGENMRRILSMRR